jgi:uncharacterized protein (DUF1015 family)
MAFVLPFRGLRYNPQKVSDLASVMSLPYDVLSEKDREDLYQTNPYNFIRLIWGKDLPGDGPQENKYLRAARLLQEWQQKAILLRDKEKAFYLYAQDFALPGQGEKSRRGIVVSVKLEDLDSHTILRHESTFPVPKADRLHLLRATRANLDSVFTLYESGSSKISTILDEGMKGSPLLDIRDREGVRHRLWALKEPGDQERIREVLADRQLLIADGHHRYEAALEYRREMMSQEGRAGKEDAGYHYAMMMLVDIEDPGLVILPYHRLIGGIPGWDLNEFLAKASRYFSVEEMRFPPAKEERQRRIGEGLDKRAPFAHSFAMYAGGDRAFFLGLKDERIIDSLGGETHSEAVRKLDVTIMDRLILHGLLGYQGPAKGERIGHTPDMKEAMRQVEDGIYDLTFLLKPTTLQEVKSISLAGERMPQKSTYFYPKLLSGLVINPHDS